MTSDDLMRRISDLVDEAIEGDPEAALQDPDDDGWEYRETTARWSAERAEMSDDDVDWTGWSGLGRELRDLEVTLGSRRSETADHWARTEAHGRMLADQFTDQFRDVLGDSVRLTFETEASLRLDEMVRRLAAGMPPAVEPSPIDGQAALEVMREWDRRLHTPTFGNYQCHLCGATGDTAASVLAHLAVMHPEPIGGTP